MTLEEQALKLYPPLSCYEKEPIEYNRLQAACREAWLRAKREDAAEAERLHQFVDFVNLWCYRESRISAAERLEAIQYHPTARAAHAAASPEIGTRKIKRPPFLGRPKSQTPRGRSPHRDTSRRRRLSRDEPEPPAVPPAPARHAFGSGRPDLRVAVIRVSAPQRSFLQAVRRRDGGHLRRTRQVAILQPRDVAAPVLTDVEGGPARVLAAE